MEKAIDEPVRIEFSLIDAPIDIQLLFIIESAITHFRDFHDMSDKTVYNVIGYLSTKYKAEEK